MPPKRKSTHADPEPKPEHEQTTRRRSSRLSKGVDEITGEVIAPATATVKKEEKPKPVKGGKAPRKRLGAVEEEVEGVKKEEGEVKKEEEKVEVRTWTEEVMSRTAMTAII